MVVILKEQLAVASHMSWGRCLFCTPWFLLPDTQSDQPSSCQLGERKRIIRMCLMLVSSLGLIWYCHIGSDTSPVSISPLCTLHGVNFVRLVSNTRRITFSCESQQSGIETFTEVFPCHYSDWFLCPLLLLQQAAWDTICQCNCLDFKVCKFDRFRIHCIALHLSLATAADHHRVGLLFLTSQGGWSTLTC